MSNIVMPRSSPVQIIYKPKIVPDMRIRDRPNKNQKKFFNKKTTAGKTGTTNQPP